MSAGRSRPSRRPAPQQPAHRDRPRSRRPRACSARRSGRLFAVAEAYPDLKASTNFLDLQQQLQDTENKIAVSRQVYNDTVLTFNNAIQVFPAVLIAGPFGFTRREFFEIEDAARSRGADGQLPAGRPGCPGCPGSTHCRRCSCTTEHVAPSSRPFSPRSRSRGSPRRSRSRFRRPMSPCRSRATAASSSTS